MLAINKSSFLMVAAACIFATVSNGGLTPARAGQELNILAPAKEGPAESEALVNRPDNPKCVFLIRHDIDPEKSKVFLTLVVYRWDGGNNVEIINTFHSLTHSIVAFHHEERQDKVQIYFKQKGKRLKKSDASYWVALEILGTLSQRFDIEHK